MTGLTVTSTIPSVPRPFLFLGLCIVGAFFTLRQFNWRDAHWPQPAPASFESVSDPVLSQDRPLTFVFTELQAAHDEVVAPLLQAFGSLPGARIERICLGHLDRFGALEMYNNLAVPVKLPQPLPGKDLFPYIWDNPPDFIVAASCGYDSFEKYERLLNESNVHIFCVVHHSDKWADWMFQFYEKRLAKWVLADRIDFVTLSQHVTDSLADSLLVWKEVKIQGHFPPIRTFPPVFTVVNQPSIEHKGNDHMDFALQGNYQAERRNFTKVFEELSRAKDQIATGKDGMSQDSSVTLHLVGSGTTKPTVPDHIRDLVIFDENLNYTDFYGVLSGMTAILPAFADSDYFVHKASSSIPAGIIAGSPIVATRQLLNAYTYVDESAVWLQRDSQTDFDVLWDIMKKPREERERKMAAAKTFGLRVVEENKRNVASWVEKALTLRQERALQPGNLVDGLS